MTKKIYYINCIVKKMRMTLAQTTDWDEAERWIKVYRKTTGRYCWIADERR